MSECMDGWVNVCVRSCVDEWIRECVVSKMSECADGWALGFVDAWIFG